MRPTAEILQPSAQTFDCLVIGGGINGTGIARDAAMRGLKVLLVEKNDLGAGTTAYSSRLIHGGLRYLETFELDLVRESLRERGILLKIAPHLVRPLPLGIPVYQESRRSLFTIQVGMILYDLLSLDARWPKHQILSKKRFQALFPGVQAEHLKGGALYYDAQVNFPERLCVENAIAAQEAGAVIWTHAEVTGLLQQENTLTGAAIRDTLTRQTYTINAKLIINASGPWVDQVLAQTVSQAAPYMGPTKGTHIIVKRQTSRAFCFPEKALYVEAQQDGRPFFILPWLEDCMLIGTTDLHYQGDLDRVIPSEAEIEYLLKETNHIFPQSQLSRQDVLLAYAGVRPLPYAGGKAAGQVTRKHIIHDHTPEGLSGLASIIGGKITTYRNLAQETVEWMGQKLQRPLPTVRTHHTPLPGGKIIPDQDHAIAESRKTYGLSAETISYLLDLYGSRYQAVLALTQENPAWKSPLCDHAPDIQAQVIYAIREEFACTVEDILMRRIGLSLREGAGLSAAPTVAALMTEELGWDTARIAEELARYTEKVETLNLPQAVPHLVEQ